MVKFMFEKGEKDGAWYKYFGTHGVKEPALLQWWGTDFRRGKEPGYWVNQLANTCEGKDNIVIPDIRFKNEARFIEQRRGVIWDVQRIKSDGNRYYSPDRDPNHPSETDLDDYTFSATLVAASGELNDLYIQADELLMDFGFTKKTKPKAKAKKSSRS
jgi:hypothetical protein